ncbi:MAG: hypothetical protein ABSH38_17680 [Verrucomicrobiota bacterium]
MDFKVSQASALAVVAAAVFGAASAIADTAGGEANPYAVISDRNVFHLNPPPPPPAPPEKPIEVPKVMLSGFQKVGGTTRVFLAMPPKDQKDVTKYFNLAPGEREDPLEVVKVNSEKGEVDIINSGTPMTLSLASNSFVATAAPSHPAGGAPPMPGMPGMPGGRRVPALPQGMPQAAAPSAPSAPSASSGNSAIIVGGGNSGGQSGSSFGSSSFGSSSYGSPIVTGGGPAYVPANPPANEGGAQIANTLMSPATQYKMPPTPPPAPPEVQAAGMLVHKAAYGEMSPPLPPGLENAGGP